MSELFLNPIRHGGGGAIISWIIKNVKCFLFNVKKMHLKLLDFLVWYIDLSFDEEKKLEKCPITVKLVICLYSKTYSKL